MKKVLPVIVLSQLSCTSLWFAVNAIMPSIGKEFALDTDYLAHLSSAVQLGFISGTLIFAVSGLADRFSPSKIFFYAALLAAIANAAILLPGIRVGGLLTLRWMTGFFLAGIYPIGMKIAADHYSTNLGKSLGFLVGALVLGTSFPHFLRSFSDQLQWKDLIYITSALSVAGGLAMILLVPDGPYRQAVPKFRLSAFRENFSNANFRRAAFGYFGHMWELYGFWVFLPVMLAYYKATYPESDLNVSFMTFIIIASGSIACVAAGLIASKKGARKTATAALAISGACCLLSPFFLQTDSAILLIIFLLIWGMSVIADSPLFSTMVAQHAIPTSRGSSLTIVNCIGFSITIASIQLINTMKDRIDHRYLYLILALGPIAGLSGLMVKQKKE
jgi:MFS family permease